MVDGNQLASRGSSNYQPSTINPSVTAAEHQDDAEEREEEDRREDDEAVAGDAFFVAERTQSLHAAGGEVVHEFGIGRRGRAEMVADTMDQRGQIVFADAEFVEV